MIGTLKSGDRKFSSRESQKTATKNNKSDQPEEFDTSSELIPRVHCNKRNTNPGKGRQQKTDSHHGTQNYCTLYRKAWYPEHRYNDHSSEKCNAFYSIKTKKGLNGRLDKRDAAISLWFRARICTLHALCFGLNRYIITCVEVDFFAGFGL